MTAIGRVSRLDGVRVAGVVACIPSRVVGNDQFAAFGDRVGEIEKMTGVCERRWVAEGGTTADLCERAATRLLAALGWEKDSVDALIFLSQTPDYGLPATACALHGRLGLKPDCMAFDVNLGCSGYPYALWLGAGAIQLGAASRVLLLVGDTISRAVDPNDSATAMLFGDAGTATALEASPGASPVTFVFGTDGRGERNLIIPQSGYRTDFAFDEAQAGRDPATLYMNGGEIFNFTLKIVPSLVSATLDATGHGVEDHDFFLFHQANLFMLRHLAKKAKLPAEKVPINIDRYGNTSSATIPLLMTTELRDRLSASPARLAMFGFGVGYSWASASLDCGPLYAETIEG
jgi:3-oxoacyl-[acyl-carrier-protein] synthase III